MVSPWSLISGGTKADGETECQASPIPILAVGLASTLVVILALCEVVRSFGTFRDSIQIVYLLPYFDIKIERVDRGFGVLGFWGVRV